MNLSTLLISLLLLSSNSANDKLSMASPSENIQSEFWIKKGHIYFDLKLNDKQVLASSEIGIIELPGDLRIENVKLETIDNNWESINGKNSFIRDHYSEYIYNLSLGEYPDLDYKITFRLYNDGIAYRYNVSSTSDIYPDILELSELSFPTDPGFWSYNGENHNIGPELLAVTEHLIIRPPAVFKIENNLYCSVLEAAIFKHSPFVLEPREGIPSVSINPMQDKFDLPLESSWRVIQLGEAPGDLIESDILVNLNEECKISDPSWIKPGKVMWDWRVWGYVAPDGFEYGLNTPSHIRFVDFASENNIQYLLLDADWYGPEFSSESDPSSANTKIDIVNFIKYARNKNVGIILYLNDIGAKEFGLERVLNSFASWGAVGVKYGFMRGSWEEKVEQTRRVVELCAERELMVNFHDNPVPPSGDRRTWPNLMTKEFCHSQADAKRSYYPETIVTSVFVNMLAGPLDMCNGWFDFNTSLARVKVFEEIPGTVAAELAKLLVVYSGWHILPDSPEEYLKKADLFGFIKDMPAEFETYRVLGGEIGQFISVARKSGSDWYIGSLTNRSERDLVIDLDFLEINKSYTATIYEDGPKTHFLNNREEYNIRKVIHVVKGDKINVSLAMGGGNAIIIKEL